MTDALSGFSALVILGLVLFALLVAILWIFVPFILMGTNSRLGRLIAEQRLTNALLDERLPNLERRGSS